MKHSFMIALSCLSFAEPAFAETSTAETPVATLVVVKTPPGISRAMIEAGFVKAAPTYKKIPGLLRKIFTVNATEFGGMYLWKNRAAAEAWYSPEWHARTNATYGVDPELTYFDSPLQIDNVRQNGK